jgi:hypothetical protein
MRDEFEEARERARSMIEATWRRLAESRTVGWGGPPSVVADRYPFVRALAPFFAFQEQERETKCSPGNEVSGPSILGVRDRFLKTLRDSALVRVSAASNKKASEFAGLHFRLP